MEFTTAEIASLLNGELVGNQSQKVNNIARIDEATEGSISFLSNPKYENYVYTTEASAIIVNKKFSPKQKVKPSLILVDDPYISFTTLLEEYQKLNSLKKSGVESPSFIAASSRTSYNIYRGAFSYIGEHCNIGENVKIYPHTYIGDNVTIGNNCIIYPGVKIYDDTCIGNYVTIQAGAVIGSDGFGFAPQQDGTYKTIPQTGNVIIRDHVDIGANTVIDCATLGSTEIKQGVKLDNLIQVAHNVEIGENTVIAAQSGISGSSKIGKNSVLAGQVGIVGHVELADKTTVAAQSGVGKSWKKEGTLLLGSPAIEHKDATKAYVVYKKLPQIQKKVEELEKKLISLSNSETGHER